jgi:hypothetical protein
MISYEELVKKPHVFKSITGLSIEEFEQLFSDLPRHGLRRNNNGWIVPIGNGP